MSEETSEFRHLEVEIEGTSWEWNKADTFAQMGANHLGQKALMEAYQSTDGRHILSLRLPMDKKLSPSVRARLAQAIVEEYRSQIGALWVIDFCPETAEESFLRIHHFLGGVLSPRYRIELKESEETQQAIPTLATLQRVNLTSASTWFEVYVQALTYFRKWLTERRYMDLKNAYCEISLLKEHTLHRAECLQECTLSWYSAYLDETTTKSDAAFLTKVKSMLEFIQNENHFTAQKATRALDKFHEQVYLSNRFRREVSRALTNLTDARVTLDSGECQQSINHSLPLFSTLSEYISSQPF